MTLNNKSIKKLIAFELNEVIEQTRNKVTPILRRINVLNPDELIEYTVASRMVALKFKKYIIPFTDEIVNELVQIAKEEKAKK